MPVISFSAVLIIALVAVAVPVALALVPRLPVPGAVLEVLAGILIGPALLGWVHVNAPIQVLSDLGLGMLLFLAGLEIDVESLRGPLGRLAGWAFGGSVLLGLACGLALSLAGTGAKPVFLAVVLTSTSAGLLLPLLKDAGQERTPFGQLVMTAAALAEVATIMMLSLLFSATSKTSADRLASLAMFLALLAAIGLALGRVRNLTFLDRMLDRLEDRSAQLRVRAALTLALAFAVLASRFGFASILGAFAAGLLVRTIDLTGRAPHPQFQVKLEGIGFGFLIPVFFITTGVQFDARALVSSPTAIAQIPLFLAALLVVRGVPALLYARRFGKRRARVAGLMQATSLTFVIVAAQIGTASGQITQTTGAALLAAGLLSAALFPATALKMLSAKPAGAEAHLARSGGMTTPIRRPAAELGRAADPQPTAIGAVKPMPPDRGDAARQPGGAVDGGSLRRVPAIPQVAPPDKFESQAAGAGG
jgi:Kef-type K+ transport system membrane component KefB